MKKMVIKDRLYTVVTMDEYTKNQELYNPKFTAIQCSNGEVLPIKNRTDSGPGCYYQPGGLASDIIRPTREDAAEYSSNKIIDYDNAKSISDIIRNNQTIRDIQADLMVTTDNILALKISPDDTPEMKALKDALNSKRCDKAQYEDRFKPGTYQNDMRLLKGKSITLAKLVGICSAFDIDATLTLSDAPGGVPNPMGHEITISLTDRTGSNNETE